MLGLNTSYLKYIILGVLLYGLVLVVNNKLLSNGQSDGFKAEKEEELGTAVEKLTTVTETLTKLVEKFETMNTVSEEKEVEDVEDVEDVVEKPKEKFRKKRETFKKKKVDEDDKHDKNEGFTNYTTGVSSAFGGDYLLLDH